MPFFPAISPIVGWFLSGVASMLAALMVMGVSVPTTMRVLTRIAFSPVGIGIMLLILVAIVLAFLLGRKTAPKAVVINTAD